jgi:hypothetical protein
MAYDSQYVNGTFASLASKDALAMQPRVTTSDGSLAAVAAAVARELVKVEVRDDGAFITTPLIYPSGANVLVKIDEVGAAEYFVSDYGIGYSEADMMGATLQFRRHAHQIAENAGVKFDSNAFFVTKVSRDQLAGACAAIANCSLEAVSIAALRLSEKKFADDADVLHRRLVTIFTQEKVIKDAPFIGASQTTWHVSNIVRLHHSDEEDHITIFEPVTKHHASIATATTKFHDIARLERPPRRVIVVRSKDDFGTYLGVLSQAADVVSRDVPDSTLKKLAA